ncbi:unnamed protein product, partial [Closterium sp. NIES-53]
MLLADPGAAGVLLADPGAAGVLLADPGTAGVLLADPGAAGVLLADPGAAGVLLADPGAAGVLLADPGAAGVLEVREEASRSTGAGEHRSLQRTAATTREDGSRCGMRRRRTLRARRRGGKEAALQQRCSVEWSGIMRHEEETDTSGKERARRQGGGTSAEVCSVVGGHFGQGGAEEAAVQQGAGAEARRRHFRFLQSRWVSSLKSRGACGGAGVMLCGMVWSGMVWFVWCGGARRTGERGGMTHGQQPLACGCLLLALLTTRSRQGGHFGQGGKHGTLGARGKKDTWGKEEEATRRHFSTALPAPSLPASDAQPDLHSVLNPFPPSRKAHGESTATEGRAAAWRGVNAPAQGGHFRRGVEEAALQVRSRGGGTSGVEEAALQVKSGGGGTSGEEWRRRHIRRGVEEAAHQARSRGGGTSGVEEAALRVRSRGGGASGEESRRRQFSEEDRRAWWDDARPAATGVWLPPTRPADHPLKARRTLRARSFDAQPDLHSVLNPFPPSTLRGERQHGRESTPSPTCKSLLWQDDEGAAARRGVNTVTDTVSLCFGRTAGEQQQGGESTPSPRRRSSFLGKCRFQLYASFVFYVVMSSCASCFVQSGAERSG